MSSHVTFISVMGIYCCVWSREGNHSLSVPGEVWAGVERGFGREWQGDCMCGWQSRTGGGDAGCCSGGRCGGDHGGWYLGWGWACNEDAAAVLPCLSFTEPQRPISGSPHCCWRCPQLLPLLLSPFSHVQLCATPETAAHQAPPPLGFSRQEHWSGLPLPSPMHARMLTRFSHV